MTNTYYVLTALHLLLNVILHPTEPIRLLVLLIKHVSREQATVSDQPGDIAAAASAAAAAVSRPVYVDCD